MNLFKTAALKLRKVFKLNTESEWSNTWFDFERRRVVGHFGKPQIGDIFTSKMISGKIGVFEVTKVDWMQDPRNMFFADVKDVGYFVSATEDKESR